MTKAIELINSDNLIKAISLSEAAVKSEYFLAKALSLQGSVQFIKGDTNSAFETLSLSIKADPNDSNVLVKLALVELERNDFMKMHENLEKAHEVDPKNPALFYHRGEIFALAGNLEQAIHDFETAIELHPGFVLAYVHKARALLGTFNQSPRKIQKQSRSQQQLRRSFSNEKRF